MKPRFYLVNDYEVLIVDSLIEELKAESQYAQAILKRVGFLVPTNVAIAVRPDAWVQLVD